MRVNEKQKEFAHFDHFFPAHGEGHGVLSKNISKKKKKYTEALKLIGILSYFLSN